MRSHIETIKSKITKLSEKKWVNSITVSAALAILWEIIIETFARHSLIAACAFIFGHPLIAIINILPIFFSLCIASLFRHRTFIMSFILFLWFALGAVNGIILLKRMTPFTINDIKMLGDGMSIVTNYLTVFQIVLVIAAIVIFVALFVLIFLKAPVKKEKVDYKRNITAFVLIGLITFASWGVGMNTGIVDTFFGSLPKGYEENGVVYGFIATWIDTGIDKPDDYSEEEILGIFKNNELENMDKVVAEEKKEDHPNIIFIQLESFMDPDMIKCVETSEPAAPYFKSLAKEVSSGWFTVPSFGAGTANIEFESMTGISARFFGPGEYPYKSVLRKETVETIPYDLKKLGYSTHAIHNHRGVFYNRNEVFPNMGIDDFDSVEYMNDVEKTAKNWEKDNVLPGEIMEALNKTEGKDFIYTISVEGHGRYPTEKTINNPAITVTKADDEALRWEYEYYVNMVKNMDDFLKEIITELDEFDEDTVVVAYGDHLPAIEMKEDDMVSGSLYKTQYIMWSNFDMPKKDKDVCAYEIEPYLLDRLGIHSGTLVSYHQNYENSKGYLKNLEALGYDMLYGKKYIYQGKTIEPTDMKMGLRDISIDEIVKIGKNYYIKGNNFTQFSYVTLDGEKLDTTYLSPTLLALEQDIDPSVAGNLKVSQIEKYDTILSTTE